MPVEIDRGVAHARMPALIGNSSNRAAWSMGATVRPFRPISYCFLADRRVPAE